MERFYSICVFCLAALVIFVGYARAEDTVIRLGYFPNITHAQALYAKATGAFDQKGNRISWQSFNAGPTAIEAIFADEIDASYIGPNPALNGFIKSRGEKFVIVSGAALGGSGLVIRTDSGINSDKDFGGKRIATPQLGNTQDVAARKYFLEKGYKPIEKGGTISITPIANPDQLVLLKKKEIDGAWTIEPWLSRLEIQGGAKLFLDEKERWPDGRYITTQLIVSRAFLAKAPSSVSKLLGTHLDATTLIQSSKAEAGRIINDQIKKETGSALPEQVINQALTRVEFTVDPVASSLIESAKAAHEIGYLREEPKLQGIYDLTYLNVVLKERGIKELAPPEFGGKASTQKGVGQ
jgi:NitT/TauT family transport system substrate-binding protein